MILFRPEHVAPILAGRKTQTRRMGKRRWNLGAVHQARSQLFGAPFACLRIVDVDRERLYAVSDADALAEGYVDRREFLTAFERINGGPQPRSLEVWVVKFSLEEVIVKT